MTGSTKRFVKHAGKTFAGKLVAAPKDPEQREEAKAVDGGRSRPFGRHLWLTRVPRGTIALAIGHADIKMTMGYFGPNMNDQDTAMRKLADFQSAVV